MVGRLARWLRILGFDVLYSNRYNDDEIVQLAAVENRIVLTRDRGLKARLAAASLIFIEHDDLDSQIAQVLQTLGSQRFQPFSRCLECNQPLIAVNKEDVFERIPPYVYLTQEQFAECPNCRRVYWRGTHASEIQNRLCRWLPPGFTV
jgi:uncharacterized protein with PIN domain